MKTMQVADPVTGEIREVPDDPKKRYEYPSSTPMAPPVGYVKSPSIAEQIRTMVRNELSQRAAEQGLETMEDADDFDVDDDTLDPRTPYERHFDPVVPAPARPDVAEAESKVVSKAGEDESRLDSPPQESERPGVTGSDRSESTPGKNPQPKPVKKGSQAPS